jgi:hypothetical protein
MTDTIGHTGYELTEQDLSQLRGFLERLHVSTGVQVSFTTGKARQFAGMTMGVHDAALSCEADVVSIQSWCPTEGAIEFAVLAAADGQPIATTYTFTTLLEALVAADIFLRRFIEGLKKKRAEQYAELGRDHVKNSIENSVLSEAEVLYVQSFARDLGKGVDLKAFANFTESHAGCVSIQLGVFNRDTPIMLGTVVAVANASGSSCSVRDFQNRPMPGSQSYSTIYAALTNTQASFEKLAQLTAKQTRPSFLRRLLG